MEFLIHFVFQLVKTAILSSFYFFILLLILQIFVRFRISWANNFHSKALAKWSTWIAICLLLLVWQKSYWGDHGLGDYSRIPIGAGKEIEQINYCSMFIRPEGHEFETLGIKNYAIDQGYCFGATSKNQQYFIWNLHTNKVQKCNTFDEFFKILAHKNLTTRSIFYDFDEAYDAFWGGWRFWLLP